MLTIEQLETELLRLAGAGPANDTTVSLSNSDGTTITLAVEQVDSLSCALQEIRLNAPQLAGVSFDLLADWANALCNQVTYLLEQIGPLELDPAAGQVLVRSTPPGKEQNATQFYEIVLQAQADGSLCLKRYLTEAGTPGKKQVPFHLTHQVLKKLVTDIVETLPQP